MWGAEHALDAVKAAFRPDREVPSNIFAFCFFLFAFSLALCAACSPARLHLIDLGGKTIDRQLPLVRTDQFSECWYWLDEQGRLRIAMSRGPLSNEDGTSGGAHSVQLSLDLDGLPAGEARDCPLTRRSLRAINHFGPQHERYASMSGIATVWRGAGDDLHGRFRATAKRQMFTVFLGWAWDAEVLLLGEFVARPGRPRGELIWNATEGGGLTRPPYQPLPTRIRGPEPRGTTTQPGN